MGWSGVDSISPDRRRLGLSTEGNAVGALPPWEPPGGYALFSIHGLCERPVEARASDRRREGRGYFWDSFLGQHAVDRDTKPYCYRRGNSIYFNVLDVFIRSEKGLRCRSGGKGRPKLCGRPEQGFGQRSVCLPQPLHTVCVFCLRRRWFRSRQIWGG